MTAPLDTAKPKHTPGPWICHHCRGGSEDSDRSTFELVVPDRDMRDTAEQDANARLIAAAPNLLQALKELEAFVRHGSSWQEEERLLRQAVLAIVGAEGQQP